MCDLWKHTLPVSVSAGDIPKQIEFALDRFGVRRKVSAFVMPMGYSFNLDGSMMYCTFAVLFIAQAYGIELPVSTQVTMLLILMLTSKGMAGVPRASLVVIAATLAYFKLPERLAIVANIPYSATGKVSRPQIAKLISDQS